MGSLQRRPSNSKRWELTTTTILRKITTITTTIIPTTTSIAFTTMETNGNYRLTFKDTASKFETYYRYWYFLRILFFIWQIVWLFGLVKVDWLETNWFPHQGTFFYSSAVTIALASVKSYLPFPHTSDFLSVRFFKITTIYSMFAFSKNIFCCFFVVVEGMVTNTYFCPVSVKWDTNTDKSGWNSNMLVWRCGRGGWYRFFGERRRYSVILLTTYSLAHTGGTSEIWKDIQTSRMI